MLMGMVGVTEGAIPFAAVDPLRVIPSLMIGSAAGSVTAMLLNVGNQAPWGGWIVLPVASNIIGYIIASLVGVVITAFMVNFIKKQIVEENIDIKEDDELAGMEIEM
jgi:fructose-specific phosphotransferase system IIC component